MCGLDSEKNCVHGSDSRDSAAREISFFFADAGSGSFVLPFSLLHISLRPYREFSDCSIYNAETVEHDEL
jgi:hypothetical protein